MSNNEIIIKVLDRASAFMHPEQVKELRGVLEDELGGYSVEPVSQELAVKGNLPGMIMLFLASKKLDGCSDNTIKNYTFNLRSFAGMVSKDVEQIKSMDIRMYIASRAKTGIKKSTAGTIISTLRSFFTWLEDEEYLIKSPMRKIKATKTDKHIRKALTMEELELLRDACETERERALAEVFYSTGARLDEVQKLNKSDIDWSTGAIVVFGKGSKERKVYLNAKAKIYLQKYLSAREDTSAALFVGERKPYNRLGRRAIENEFKKLGQRAGLTKKVYPHLLRHTTATHLLNNGSSLSVVQKYLGHTNPSTTEIYAQLNTDEIQQSLKKHLA